MADTIQNAFAYLTAWSTTFKTHYAPGITDRVKRHGLTTKLLDFETMRLDGNRLEFELKRFPNRGVQATRDMHAVMPPHKPGKYAGFQLRFDETSPSGNDFIMLNGGVQTTFWSIEKKMDAMWKGDMSFLDADVKELTDDFKEQMARSIHLPSDGKLATIATGGVKNDDSFTSFSSNTAYTSGSTTAAILVDSTSMAKLPEGANIEIRTAGGVLRVNNVLITRCEPSQKAIHVQLTADSVNSVGATVSNLNLVVATDTIYVNGSYNAGVPGSLSSFFDETAGYYRDVNGTPISNRKLAANKQFMPRTIAAAAANTDLTEGHLRAVGETVGYTVGDGNAVVQKMAVMARDGYNGLVKLGKDSAYRILPARESEVGRQLSLAFGFDQYVFHDPNLGTIAAVVDDFAEYGKIRFLDREDWKLVSPIAGGLQWVPGPIAGQWFQVADAGGTPSLRYAARAIMPYALVCVWPQNQIQLTNLNTAA
jgi:hypothetical protein